MGDMRQQGPSPELDRPKAGTPVFVDIFYDSSIAPDPFRHEWRFDGYPGSSNGPIDVPAKKDGEPGTPIRFQLHGGANFGLKFVDTPKQAIWLSRTQCPQQAGGDPEIPPDQIEPQQRLLKIYDLNEDECTIHYRLRFKSDNGEYSYDPEIRNGGKTIA